MKQTIIIKNTWIDTDYSNAKDFTTLVLENEQPYITDIKKTILNDVTCNEEYKPFIQQQIKANDIAEKYLQTPNANCKEECDRIRCGWKENQIFLIELYSPLSDYRTTFTYLIQLIDTNKTVFLPIAYYPMALKYGNTQERIFTRKVFNTYNDAKNWFENFKKENPDFTGYESSIMPIDKEYLKTNTWYQTQIKILNHTNGFTEEFKKNFSIHSKKMFCNLFGKNEWNTFIKSCHNHSYE